MVQNNLTAFVRQQPTLFVVAFATSFLAIDVVAGLLFMPERLEWQSLALSPVGGVFWALLIVLAVKRRKPSNTTPQ